MTDAPVRYSLLKYLRGADGSPFHYHYRLHHPTPETDAMRLGTLIHTAVFEPDKLMEEYSVWNGARRGKEYTAFKDTAEKQDRIVITDKDWTTACAVRDSIRNHPVIGPYLDDGEPEVTLEWVNRETGLKCRSRVDWIGDDYMLDLKTTATGISPRLFSASSWKMAYWFQAAMYQEGYAETHQGQVQRMGIIAAESKPPYAARLYWLSDAGLVAAWDEYIECLKMVRDCMDADTWPGPEAETTLEPPAWAVQEQEESLTIGGEAMVL